MARNRDIEELVGVRIKRWVHRKLVALCKLHGITFKELVDYVLEGLVNELAKDDSKAEELVRKIQERKAKPANYIAN